MKMRWHDWLLLICLGIVVALAWTDLQLWVESWVK
jgi:hypothetical protein